MSEATEKLPRFRVVCTPAERTDAPPAWVVLDSATGHRTPAPDQDAATRAADVANKADAVQQARKLAGARRLLKDVFDRR